MTLDEVMKHCEEVVDLCEDSVSKYDMTDALESHFACQDGECAEEHRQIAEWLKELKRIKEQEPCEDMGEVSDGYHTFNQLYHQRAILFATIVNQNKDKAWKSYKHSDGKYCFDGSGEWFIVGVDTPEGSYTYHYSKEYWDYFECKELDCGKEWDGHPEQDVTRLLSLKKEPCEMSVEEYRQRMIQAFHNADCDELIALVCLPTEQEFEHLEWLLKTFYNRLCEDCISREEVINKIKEYFHDDYYQRTSIQDCRDCLIEDVIKPLPPVMPQPKTGHWIDTGSGQECSECGEIQHGYDNFRFYCPNCGCRMLEGSDG